MFKIIKLNKTNPQQGLEVGKSASSLSFGGIPPFSCLQFESRLLFTVYVLPSFLHFAPVLKYSD